ncbi:MAG: type II secretion system protein [Oscillospiraceae bacterium]
MKNFARLKAKKAFTLVELVVVIAIIGVLAAILIPTLIGAVRSANVASANTTASDVRTAVNNWLTKQSAKHIDAKLSGSDGSVYVKIIADNGVYQPPEFVGDFWLGTVDENELSADLKKYIEDTLGYRRMYSIGYMVDGRVGALYYFDGGTAPQGAPTLADFQRTDFWPGENGYTADGDVIGTAPVIVNG